VLLAYVILLPDNVHNFVRRVQADVYTRYDASPFTLPLEPHVTLKQPFAASEIAPHEDYLDRLAAETEPFELLLRGLAVFEGDEGVLFLDVEQDPRLLRLQRRILHELELEPVEFESGEPRPYYFHATIATGLAPTDLADAQARHATTPEFRFQLERLGLFRETLETWTLYKRSKL
jgi:2'-5' RNA ligase